LSATNPGRVNLKRGYFFEGAVLNWLPENFSNTPPLLNFIRMELIGLITFVLSLGILIAFFIMASNVSSILKASRRIELELMDIRNALEKLKKGETPKENETPKDPSKMTTEEKARAFDRFNK
jgi:hypothetical protein